MAEATPLYPNSIDSDISLIEAKDNKYTTLAVGADAVVTIFEVNSTDGFPDTGYISVNGEIVRYLEKDATHFGTVANPLERGMQGTVASIHEAGDKVYLNVLAIHHNILREAIVKIETELGTNVKGSAADLKERLEKLLKYSAAYKCFEVEQ